MNPEYLLMLAMPRPGVIPMRREKPASAWGSGDKVICIDAKGLRRTYVPGPLVEGHLYCVREVYADRGCHDRY